MANEKVTSKDILNRIISAMADDPEVVAWCEKKIAQAEAKRGSADSKKAAENAKYFIAIAEVLNKGGMRASEVHKALVVQFPDVTVQKVTAMLGKMVESGEVIKSVDKKVSTFSLA